MAISLIGQLILLVIFLWAKHEYCLTDSTGCLEDIFFKLWWLSLFVTLSNIGIFALLVIGVYMLVRDIAKEERRDTLNFIRPSPRSTQTILLGKMMGVPILLYIVAVLALPLHLWAGIAATIPLGKILAFDAVLVASCIFFYSAAQLFTLATTAFLKCQAWLASGFMLMFLCILFLKHYKCNYLPLERELRNRVVLDNCLDWLLNLFDPWVTIPYIIQSASERLEDIELYFHLCYSDLASWQWFGLPLGTSAIAAVSLVLVNYALWNYWIWHGLSRCFPNPSAKIIGKRQSYVLVASFQVAILGFARVNNSSSSNFMDSCTSFLLLNFFLFLGLIAILSPNRQNFHDWARYRLPSSRADPRADPGKHFRNPSWQDWIWGEKSPAPVAIAINLLITAAFFIPWIVLYDADNDYKMKAIAYFILYITLILTYALIAQLILLIKLSKRKIWAARAVAVAIILPPILLFILSARKNFIFTTMFSMLQDIPKAAPFLWTFSILPLLDIQNANTSTSFIPFLSHLFAIGGLSLCLKRHLERAGTSAIRVASS